MLPNVWLVLHSAFSPSLIPLTDEMTDIDHGYSPVEDPGSWFSRGCFTHKTPPNIIVDKLNPVISTKLHRLGHRFSGTFHVAQLNLDLGQFFFHVLANIDQIQDQVHGGMPLLWRVCWMRMFVSIGLHMNVRIQVFPAKYCSVDY